MVYFIFSTFLSIIWVEIYSSFKNFLILNIVIKNYLLTIEIVYYIGIYV